MDVSNVPRLGSSRKEAKDNREFEYASEVEGCFSKFLKIAGQKLENPSSASSETLKEFLESINKNSRASFKEFLKKSGLATKTGYEYTEFKRQYGPMAVNQMIYLIDEEFLVKRGRIYTILGRQTSAQKIRIIMSTILWMEKLFPSEGVTWKMRFLNFPGFPLKEDLDWLLRIHRDNYLMGQQLSERDRNILDKLCNWLEAHDERPTKLAFAMASYGMVKGKLEGRQLYHIIDELKSLVGMSGPLTL